MKEKTDFSLIRTLLKKQWLERTYGFKRGNFDIVGFILRAAIAAAFVAVFVIFFGRFTDIYTVIKTNRQLNVTMRVSELLTIVYTLIIVFMTIGAISQINRQIFAADDIKLFSAMPVGAKSLYISKLLTIYLGQFVYGALVVLTVNITIAAHTPQGWTFYLLTGLTCLLLPLVTIAIGSLLALPFHLLKEFLKEHFIINFVLVTALAGLLFFLYSRILIGVKEMLFGDSLRYFFSERVMNRIDRATSFMYPAKWLSNLMLGLNVVWSTVGIVITLAVCLVVSMIIIRGIMGRALQSRMAGSTHYIKRGGRVGSMHTGFFALVKKEFLLIFRTPSYMFSYFSVALIMPLMVFFCMDTAVPLIERLVGINDCNLELAIFLTLLFGALTNVFCATNVSRDGAMFYSVKALPLSCKKVFFSKVCLCMAVTVLTQLASAITLMASPYLAVGDGFFLFVVGTAFSFVQICVATRYDFNHAKFSTEDDGEIKESSNVVSTLIVLGLITSVLVGGIVVLIKVYAKLKNVPNPYLTYIIAGAAAAIAAVLAGLYFIIGLEKKYYSFEGGSI